MKLRSGKCIHSPNTILRVGTDCSGIEAPIQALIKLKIPFIHEFCSDVDPYCIQSIKANYSPNRIYGDKNGSYPEGDIRLRDHTQLPNIDLYVAGPPCQSFSMAGNRKGINDPRGNVFFAAIETIKIKKPKMFILENVKGLLSANNGKTWETIWNALSTIDGYNVEYKILNTKDYGIPPNRERLYIVGRRDGKVAWGDKITELPPLTDYVDVNDISKTSIPPRIIKNGLLDKVNTSAIFVDCSFTNYIPPYAHIYSSCITRKSEIWTVPMHRRSNINELLMLQGFPTTFKQVVSDTRMKYHIGNSMSVNVLESIYNANKSIR